MTKQNFLFFGLFRIDWKNYHMVYLEKNIGEVIGVLGLTKDHGITPARLTSTWDEKGKMLVMKNEPITIEELTNILMSYLNDDMELKSRYE